MEIGSCSYSGGSSSSSSRNDETNYRAPVEVVRTMILIIAVSTTLFMVTDYATMAARFCYRVYAGGDF